MTFEVSDSQVLLVCRSGGVISQLRAGLTSLHISFVTTPSHLAAVGEIKNRNFTHVVFETRGAEISALTFIKELSSIRSDFTLIAVVEQPEIDEVFALLKAGVAGFLVNPFSAELLEEVFITATAAPPALDRIDLEVGRNGPLAVAMLNSLDRLATAVAFLRSGVNDLAINAVETTRKEFYQSVQLGRYFCEGGLLELRSAIVERCIARAMSAPTRLSKLRQELRRIRSEEAELELQAAAE